MLDAGCADRAAASRERPVGPTDNSAGRTASPNALDNFCVGWRLTLAQGAFGSSECVMTTKAASETGGCVRVTVMNIVDSSTVCATRVAENARTSKTKSLKTTAVIERLTVGHFGWPIREKFS